MVVVVMKTGRRKRQVRLVVVCVTSNPLYAVSEYLRLGGLAMFS